MTKPIAHKITRLSDGAHTGWSLSVDDYERAVVAMGNAIWAQMISEDGYTEPSCARAALKAIGIVAPKTAKGAK